MIPFMGDVVRDDLETLLHALETELRAQQRWEAEQPAESALQSTQPFAVDTLHFDQWLQWIFLPRMHALLTRQHPLPRSCAIRPIAEEVYRAEGESASRILRLISEIDKLLNGHPGGLN